MATTHTFIVRVHDPADQYDRNSIVNLLSTEDLLGDQLSVGAGNLREPFPVEKFSGACPNCGVVGTIQSVCLDTHIWEGGYIHDGVLSFDGHFDFVGESINSHIACYKCGTEWDEPDEINYI